MQVLEIDATWQSPSIVKLVKNIKELAASLELEKLRELADILSFNVEVRDRSVEYFIHGSKFQTGSGEQIFGANDFYGEFLHKTSGQAIEINFGFLRLKIDSLIKLLSVLKTKILQLKKLNKRRIFRTQVHLIFKNLDDTHSALELFTSNDNSSNHSKIKYYSTWNQHRHSLYSCLIN